MECRNTYPDLCTAHLTVLNIGGICEKCKLHDEASKKFKELLSLDKPLHEHIKEKKRLIPSDVSQFLWLVVCKMVLYFAQKYFLPDNEINPIFHINDWGRGLNVNVDGHVNPTGLHPYRYLALRPEWKEYFDHLYEMAAYSLIFRFLFLLMTFMSTRSGTRLIYRRWRPFGGIYEKFAVAAIFITYVAFFYLYAFHSYESFVEFQMLEWALECGRSCKWPEL